MSQKLSTTLDNLLDEATNKNSSFRDMARAAGLDPSYDFIGARLRNMDFRDEDLRGFNFSRADLTGSDFRRANVESATFHGANLKGTIGLPEIPTDPIGMVLPRVSANILTGLVETLAAPPYNGVADLPVLADELHLELDELVPIVAALQLLRFVEFRARGDLKLTDAGKEFAELGTDDRKSLFRERLLAHVPLARFIRDHLLPLSTTLRKSTLTDRLENYMSAEDAEDTLRAVIGWGRYAEVFVYNDDSGIFSPINITMTMR
jgi:hypothetical protein